MNDTDLLLVEDDTLLGEGLVTALQREGYRVRWCQSGARAREAMQQQVPAITVLDLGLPGEGGLSLLTAWRRQGITCPVLILTARDTPEDRITGLDTGADDYLGKPFDLGELLARLRALQRRQQQASTGAVTLGRLQLDTERMTASLDGQTVDLSRREFALLSALASRPGHVFSRQALEEALYDWEDAISSNTLEVHIHNLRRKLYPELVRTVRGVGYALETGSPA